MKSKLYSISIALIFLLTAYKSFSQANTSLSNLASTTAINHSLSAGATNSLSLGSSTKAWKNIYLSNGIYINNALLFSTPHQSSIAIGNKALYLNSPANSLIAIGDSAFYHNTTGARGTAVGSYSLFKNTTGDNNTTLGYQTLYNTTIGTSNVATGMQALYSNTTGNNNIACGAKALYSNTTGYSNVAVGIKALYSNTTGSSMIAIGDSALYNANNVFYQNIAIGSKALYTSTTGYDNTAVGYQPLYNNTTGGDNTAIGHALYNNTTGTNVGIGYNALNSNTTGSLNLADGNGALYYNTTGSFNTGVGFDALYTNSTGSYNTAIGLEAGVGQDGGSTNATALGYIAVATASNEVMLGNSSVTAVEAYAPYYNVSDGRVKKNIKENVPGLAFINALRPVTYNYDVHGINDKTGLTAMQNKAANSTSGKASTTSNITLSADRANEDAISTKEKIQYTGFVAQEVETAAKKLNYDFSGIHTPANDKDLYALSYSDFVVPLVKAVQELSKMNDAKDARIDSLENKNNNLEARLSKLETLMNISNQPTSISSASLAQNVPNPVTNSTSINYSIPQASTSAFIILTDNKGSILKQISLNTKGNGSINVDASTLAASAYQYSLYVNGKLIDTKQMVLAR